MSLADHLRLLRERRSTETLEVVLATLEGIPFTVVGGWAVHAHGSSIPSVDMDIWIDPSHHDAVHRAFLEQHGIQLETEGGRARFNLDIDYLDSRNHLFGGAGSFVRGSLVTERRTLLGHDVDVLTGPELLFSKAKAFHDRSRQWALAQDPSGLAALRLKDPEEAAFIRERGEAYWLRKAGKDLMDVRFLQERYEMGGPTELRAVVEARIVDPHPALVAWGA